MLRMQDLFRVMDVDKNGTLQADEFLNAMKELLPEDHQVSAEDVRLLVTHFDDDGSGDIDYAEFMTLVSTKVNKAADIVRVERQATATGDSLHDEQGLRSKQPRRIVETHKQRSDQVGNSPALVAPGIEEVQKAAVRVQEGKSAAQVRVVSVVSRE